jgi:hypothetical protein
MLGRLHVKHAAQSGIWGTNSVFAVRVEENKRKIFILLAGLTTFWMQNESKAAVRLFNA